MKFEKLTLFSKSVIIAGLMLATTTTSAQKETKFKLDPSTNMLMTGKEPEELYVYTQQKTTRFTLNYKQSSKS